MDYCYEKYIHKLIVAILHMYLSTRRMKNSIDCIRVFVHNYRIVNAMTVIEWIIMLIIKFIYAAIC
jgi:hypothetical protein